MGSSTSGMADRPFRCPGTRAAASELAKQAIQIGIAAQNLFIHFPVCALVSPAMDFVANRMVHVKGAAIAIFSSTSASRLNGAFKRQKVNQWHS